MTTFCLIFSLLMRLENADLNKPYSLGMHVSNAFQCGLQVAFMCHTHCRTFAVSNVLHQIWLHTNSFQMCSVYKAFVSWNSLDMFFWPSFSTRHSVSPAVMSSSHSSPREESSSATSPSSSSSQSSVSPGPKSFYPRQGATSKYLIGWRKPGSTINSVDFGDTRK